MKTTHPSRGFTLLELIITVAVIAVLAALTVPVLNHVRAESSKAVSANALNQLRLAGEMYLMDNNGTYWQFAQSGGSGKMRWWFGFGDGPPVPEGQRQLDYSKGLLGQYFGQTSTLQTDPAFARYGKTMKPKFATGAFGFGYNMSLMNANRDSLADPSRVIVFGTSAQVNNFQKPASSSNPMIEEFYMLNTNATSMTMHYRFGGKAMVVFADGRVDYVSPDANSFDPRMVGAKIGPMPAAYRNL